MLKTFSLSPPGQWAHFTYSCCHVFPFPPQPEPEPKKKLNYTWQPLCYLLFSHRSYFTYHTSVLTHAESSARHLFKNIFTKVTCGRSYCQMLLTFYLIFNAWKTHVCLGLYPLMASLNTSKAKIWVSDWSRPSAPLPMFKFFNSRRTTTSKLCCDAQIVLQDLRLYSDLTLKPGASAAWITFDVKVKLLPLLSF